MKFAIALLSVSLMSAHAQNIPAPESQPVVALLTAVGDRIEVVRQRQTVGSNLEPFTRQVVHVPSQTLNYAALRGLAKAMAEEEPQDRLVLLRWTIPAELAERMEAARGIERQQLVLDAVLGHLRQLPQRSEWDRIELLVPAYAFAEVAGMGPKLSGIGVYIQPLSKQSADFGGMGGNDAITLSDVDGDFRTINPNTGELGNSSVFVAPFMYFDRLTYDARTLVLVKRQRYFSNTKYADPMSSALDVADQMPQGQLIAKMVETIEHSAYKSVRQTKGEVTVSAPKPVSAVDGAASAPR
ncbi:MAG TPA: hypothetical protein VGM81_02125 [Burkholderiaceae bacterium]|jgi:hypothetical protein